MAKGKKHDYRGKYIGMLRVMNPAPSRVLESGMTASFWYMVCINCGYEFEMQTRAITKLVKNCEFPKGCSRCLKPKKKRPYKYAKNINGFPDYSKKIYEE